MWKAGGDRIGESATSDELEAETDGMAGPRVKLGRCWRLKSDEWR